MEKILVTGATGKLGRELIPRLLSAGREVKAGTRDPQRAQALFGGAAEAVELDYERTETWDAAVMWADRILLIPPPFDPQADQALVPFMDWAVASGVGHVVLVSAMGVEALDDLPLRRVERRIEAVGVPFTFLRPNLYMQNFLASYVVRPIGERRAFALSAGAGQVSFVDVREVAEVAAAALTSDAHQRLAYTLTGPEALSFGAAAPILAAAAGSEVRYEPISDSQMQELLQGLGWRPEQAQVAVGLFRSVREGARAAVTSDMAAVLGRNPRDFRSFAQEHAAAWR